MPIEPFLDWSAYRDAGLGDAYADIPKSGGVLAKAISVCIDNRRCQSRGKGVMCPSYRVTSETSLSTGGRVRLPKTALNSKRPHLSLEDPELARAIDLCIACKGCKRERENRVDMATIKSEYLAQRYSQGNPTLRTHWLGNLSVLLHHFPLGRRLVESRNRFPAVAGLVEKSLGISRQRSLPLPATSTALRQQAKQPVMATAPPDSVALLIDTFTNSFAPQTAAAARLVLERAGYPVHLAQPSPGERPLCCGRTQLANGLLPEAKREARRLTEPLLPHLRAGRPTIGLEPACLLAVREDSRFLGLGESATRIAKRAVLFEEFLGREITRKRFVQPAPGTHRHRRTTPAGTRSLSPESRRGHEVGAQGTESHTGYRVRTHRHRLLRHGGQFWHRARTRGNQPMHGRSEPVPNPASPPWCPNSGYRLILSTADPRWLETGIRPPGLSAGGGPSGCATNITRRLADENY